MMLEMPPEFEILDAACDELGEGDELVGRLRQLMEMMNESKARD